MITSKLTRKAQTTIPAPVQAALRLKAGDELVYSIEGERVVLTKAERGPLDDPFAIFDEWDSAVDRLSSNFLRPVDRPALSTPPAGLAQAVEQVGMIFRPHPRRAPADIRIE